MAGCRAPGAENFALRWKSGTIPEAIRDGIPDQTAPNTKTGSANTAPNRMLHSRMAGLVILPPDTCRLPDHRRNRQEIRPSPSFEFRLVPRQMKILSK